MTKLTIDFLLRSLQGSLKKIIRRSSEAHRALELLEDYHSRLLGPQDRALRIAIERVIRIFKSRLFQALLAIQLEGLQRNSERLQMKIQERPGLIREQG
uniref:Uncharacterized protein n=1 Tax=Phlebotomus papatasi TaxID=29031 RepID=A0A1B0DAZ9_PHLPP